MPLLRLVLASGEQLEVHHFSVREGIASLFTVRVLARSPDPALDLRALLGRPAALHIADADRRWCGVCTHARLVQAVDIGVSSVGLSTYEITIVPRLWLLTQRTSYRIFQHRSIPAIARELLDGWAMTAACRWCVREDQHPLHPYRVQYGETDYHFLSRLLEEAGIAFTHEDSEGEDSALVLSDALHETAPRREPALEHVESPTERSPREWVTRVSVAEELRPDAVLLRDQDFRRPLWPLVGEARREPASPHRVERYQPWAFLVDREADGWHDDAHGAALAARDLESARSDRCLISFESNAADLRPGSVLRIEGHPRPELDPRVGLLVTSIAIAGSPHGDWSIRAEAVPASEPYRPPRRAVKPAVYGVQSATVIGPPGQEIHTDEHGRVRVQFPWDREGQGSCWLRVSQGWAGAGLGLFALPRIGQEVLVTFLGGDPDQPILVGRVGNALNPPPLKLPEEKTQSVWKSATSPGGEGWSEIRIEDSRGAELLSVRAERDMGMVIRRDRTEAVGGDETSRVEGRLVMYVGQDAHVTAAGEHRARVGGTRSVIVDGDQHQRVGGLAALGAGAIHIQAEGPVVIEGADITLRGPGGFVRIDGGGVTIDGGAVNIQKGGAPGAGPGAKPAVPLMPERADHRGPGPRRLPLIGFPGLPPIPMQPSTGGPRPLTPEEMIICSFICQCKDMKLKQVCVTEKIRAYDAAQGGMSKLKAEVPYDMTTDPPSPIMSRTQPWRPSRGSYKNSRKPDVVVLKDPTKPPTQDNIERIIEIKFDGDYWRDGQFDNYREIAGKAQVEELRPKQCGCPDPERPKPRARELTATDTAEVLVLALVALALILDDAVPGGQLDDYMIPPIVARILDRLAPLLRAAPIVP